MAKSDSRDWGNFAEMVCTHSDRCARPRFIRGRIGWTPSTIDILGDSTGVLNWLLNLLYLLVPGLFGGRVVVCVTCNDMSFMGNMGMRLYRVIRFLYTPEEESILFIDQDVVRIGDFAVSLDLESLGD